MSDGSVTILISESVVMCRFATYEPAVFQDLLFKRCGSNVCSGRPGGDILRFFRHAMGMT